MEDKEKRIKELEAAIADLNSRMPAHSVKPQLIQQLEDWEEELERLKHK